MKILIIDDNPADRDLIIRQLRKEFPDAVLLEVGKQADLEQALASGEFNLILTDYRLQWSDGLTVLSELKSRLPAVPVIMITDSGSEEIAVAGMKAGLSDYVIKNHLHRLPVAARESLHKAELQSRYDESSRLLKVSEERYRAITELVSDYAYSYSLQPDGTLKMEWATEALSRITGYTLKEIEDLGGEHAFIHPEDLPDVQHWKDRLIPGERDAREFRVVTKSGEIRWLRGFTAPVFDETQGRVVKVYGAAQDITERKQRELELRAMVAVATALRSAPTRAGMLPVLLDETTKLLRAQGAVLDVLDMTTGELVTELAVGSLTASMGLRIPPGAGMGAHVLATARPYLNNGEPHDPRLFRPELINGSRCVACIPLIAQEHPVGTLWIGRDTEISPGELRLLTAVGDMAASAIYRATLHEQTERRAREFAALYETTHDLATHRDLPNLLRTVTDRASKLLNTPDADMYLYDARRQDLELVFGKDGLVPAGTRFAIPEGLCGRVAELREPLIVDDYAHWEGRSPKYEGLPLTSAMGVPMLYGGDLIGVLTVAVRDATDRKFQESDAKLLSLFAGQVAGAVHNTRLLADVRRNLERVQALHSIDVAITASLDLRLTLNVLLEHVTIQLGVDTASVLLLDSHSQILEFSAGRGFRGAEINRTRLRLGEGLAGRAALSRQTVSVADLQNVPEKLVRTGLFAAEGFGAYFAVPLLAKGEVKGVLEVFHRTSLVPDQDWLDFLEALAGQAAIAVDNAHLFGGLQQSNAQLALAYDATLEGWSRALDLRDKETEGHTQRVTEMTMALARAMGLSADELVHVQRGALLHDIGKMGIPDAILLKPGPLTDDEWVIMRKHPNYALELLSPIAYLRPALDIPHAHHEKWDGSGYPRGLNGERIPLAARIFAVADVWDALRSDRPYRKGWSEEEVIEHIRQGAGTHFDPTVVEAFLRMMSAN